MNNSLITIEDIENMLKRPPVEYIDVCNPYHYPTVTEVNDMIERVTKLLERINAEIAAIEQEETP